MAEQMKIRTHVDGQLVEKLVNVPRTTSKERRKATRVYSWEIRAHYAEWINKNFGPIFSKEVPPLWEEIIADPTVRKATLRKSHRVVSEYVRNEEY